MEFFIVGLIILAIWIYFKYICITFVYTKNTNIMKTTKILVRVEQDLKDEAVKTAKAMGVSLSGYVRMLILKEFKL